jgi:peptidoglycan glycosyltransferase
LVQAVTDGSARGMLGINISSAGKTGTAQVSGGQDPHAWFTTFAPAENPEIVLTILIENGRGGDVVSVPVARNILNRYFNEK